jgi:hypothetical protein
MISATRDWIGGHGFSIDDESPGAHGVVHIISDITGHYEKMLGLENARVTSPVVLALKGQRSLLAQSRSSQARAPTPMSGGRRVLAVRFGSQSGQRRVDPEFLALRRRRPARSQA